MLTKRVLQARLSAHRLCLILFVGICLLTLFASRRVLTASAENSSLDDVTSPTLSLGGLRQYSRISGQVIIPVSATDNTGVSRIELYLDGQLLSSFDVLPNLPIVFVSFSWDTTLITNGKHTLHAKAYDGAGNSNTRSLAVICHNFGPVTTPTPPVGNNIVLNPAVLHQAMTGWEMTSQAGQLESPAWNNYKNSLLDQATNDLGINRIRTEIPSGIENPIDYYAQWRAGQITGSQYLSRRYEIVNDNTDPNTVNPNGFKWSSLDGEFDDLVLPLRQRLQARGEALWISICYVDFGSSPFEHKTTPAEYAEFVLATYQHLQSRYGIVPDSWEVILEPDTATAAWSSVQVAQAIKTAGDRLAAAGYIPNFVAPSTTNAENAPIFIDQIAQTAGAMQYVREFSYHRYCCATPSVLQGIASRAVQHNKSVGMLEYIGADFQNLHDDIKIGRNSSWQQFTLAFPNEPDNGAQYYLINDAVPTLPIITMASRTRLLRQYFKFIRRGARRMEALTGNSGFDPLAFVNPDGKYAVIVKATIPGTFNVHGLPAGTYGLKYSTSTLYNIDLPDITIAPGQPLPATIPSAGVISIYRR